MTEAWNVLSALLGLDVDVSDVNIGQMALRTVLVYGAAVKDGVQTVQLQ